MEAMMADQAHISAQHIHPETGLVYRVIVAVRYGPGEADIHMPLEPPSDQRMPGEIDWASRLRELGYLQVPLSGSSLARQPRRALMLRPESNRFWKSYVAPTRSFSAGHSEELIA